MISINLYGANAKETEDYTVSAVGIFILCCDNYATMMLTIGSVQYFCMYY